MICTRLFPLLAGLVLIVGCQQAGEGEGSVQKLADAEEGSQQSAAEVRLRSDGVEITGAEGTYLAFDSPRETVEIELAGVLGPIVDRSRNEECGAGTVTSTSFPGGLTVNFQAGRLKGWVLSGDESTDDGEPEPIATAEGISLKSDEATLDAAYTVEAMDSTLGDEFTPEEGISGFLTGSEGSRTVEALYSGTTCFFR